MELVCPHCNQVNRYTARFCQRCGKDVGKTRFMPASTPVYPPSGVPTQPQVLPPLVDTRLTGLLPAMSILHSRYRIIEKRAEGGMATVYRALDLHLSGKVCAIKEMSDAMITDPLDRQRAVAAFQQEAQMLAALSHPYLPKVSDYFSENGREYLVMEFIEGQSLDEMLAARGNNPFSESQVLNWAFELCDVLDYLHQKNRHGSRVNLCTFTIE